MRRIIGYFGVMTVMLSFFSLKCHAIEMGYIIEFKAGEYYFDNTKLHFSTVKMVLGYNGAVIVREMSPLPNKNWWKTTIDENMWNLDGFCFIDSNTDPGNYDMDIEDFISKLQYHDNNLRQTRLRTSLASYVPSIAGWVFYPINDAEISDGYWRSPDSYDATPSRTLPIIHVNTQNSQMILDKENYLDGTFWLDNCGMQQYQSLGSESSPLTIQIKGRGNWTWEKFYKKPYKVKFAQKVSPLGLDKSKHFILKPDAGDLYGYVRNETGFELSRQFGMPYTTRQLPVEVVLNGEYIGLYFLCEKIRVEEGRVDIFEQQDNETIPENVTGGWLLENDWEGPIVNAQHQGNDPNELRYAWSSKSPEALSLQQYNYITPLLRHIDECIFVSDKTDNSWENYIDIDYLTRFYVIQEIMDGVESFTRSLFMYKDLGEDEKFIFGPMWDFDCSYMIQTCDHFIYDYDCEFKPWNLWIRELVKFPHFQQKIREVWKEFKDKCILDKVHEHMAQWRSMLTAAEASDDMRWRFYPSNHPAGAPTEYFNLMDRKVAWLNEHWSVPEGDVNLDGVVTAADVTEIYNYLLNGDETYKSTCDVNGDGEITAADVTALYDILLEN